MNITWFIGNGLDIRLGMPTRYSDFANYRLPKEFTDASQSDKVLQQRRNKEIKRISRLKVPRGNQNLELLFLLKYQEEKWSDLELCLGDFTDEVSIEELDNFVQHLNRTLVEYLKDVQSSINVGVTSDERDAIIRCLLNPMRGFPPVYRDYLGDADYQSPNSIEVVNFNYTSTFKSFNVIGNYGEGVIHSPVHVHQKLGDNGVLLGLDNVKQIRNRRMKKDENICQLIVKPLGNRFLGLGIDQEVENIIEETSVFCLFGVSLGETDRTWWHLIGDRFKRKDSVLIIFFKYDKEAEGKMTTKYLEFEKNARRECMKALGLKGAEKKYRERILVQINTNKVFPSREMQQLP